MPLLEFIGRIAKLHRNRYMVEIPAPYRKIAEQLHGMTVRVIIDDVNSVPCEMRFNADTCMLEIRQGSRIGSVGGPVTPEGCKILAKIVPSEFTSPHNILRSIAAYMQARIASMMDDEKDAILALVYYLGAWCA